jgi:ribonuclease HI
MAGRGVTTTVYTDGACLGNPGPGGWAWAVLDDAGAVGRYASGHAELTTNQRMEISAVLEATRAIEGPIDVVSDSTYVVNCWRDRWWEAWVRNGWRNKARKEVANQDLWKPLVEEFRTGRITMRWVKGHSGDPMNDLVDRLATAAAATQTGRAGSGVPDDIAELPADAPARAGVSPSADPRIPAGHRLVVMGHRPPELGGYDDDNPVAAAVRRELTDIVAAKRAMHPELVVLTGLALGAEQLGAQAAHDAGVPYVAVLPYPDPERVWPAASQRRYRDLLDGARSTVLLQAKAPESKQAAGGALARRDAWLARHADEAIAVWDGDDQLVGRAVRSLRDHLGEEDVWVLTPPSG